MLIKELWNRAYFVVTWSREQARCHGTNCPGYTALRELPRYGTCSGKTREVLRKTGKLITLVCVREKNSSKTRAKGCVYLPCEYTKA